jgi:hypothetical protein
MRWLLFLSRLAFICNIFFLLAVSLQLSNWIHNQQLVSTVVIIGYVMGFILNPVLLLCYLIQVLLRKKFWQSIPPWLIFANIILTVILVLYIIFFLNYGSFNT